VGPGGLGVYLDFGDAIRQMGVERMRERYGNLFEMYERIRGENAYEVPMRMYPAMHYTMGGLWVDYHLMSNLPGLFVIGEANFSDHGANRLGASGLMQGLADGYFILPHTIGHYFASGRPSKSPVDHPGFAAAETEVKARLARLLSVQGKRTVTSFHRELGRLLWNDCGMTRSEAGLREALRRIPELRAEFWGDVKVSGSGGELNQDLERANQVADYLELSELVCRDALMRRESCGGHFRTESVTEDGEAKRDDAQFAFVGAWECRGADREPTLHKEPLEYEEARMSTRSYR